MAQFDIMPWSDDFGCSPPMDYALINDGATETFRVGEPVSLNAAGKLTESADDPVAMDFAGIAMAPLGYSIGGTATTKNLRTGAAYQALDLCPYVKALPGRHFIARRFATDGAGTDLLSSGLAYATALALVGEAAGMTLTGAGNWVIDTGHTADREVWRIVKWLDANRTDILTNGANARYVIVTPIQSMWLPNTDAAGSLAAIA